jgi:hypothetical protein
MLTLFAAAKVTLDLFNEIMERVVLPFAERLKAGSQMNDLQLIQANLVLSPNEIADLNSDLVPTELKAQIVLRGMGKVSIVNERFIS